VSPDALPRNRIPAPFPRLTPADRRGYDPDFLSIPLPLPTLSHGREMVSPPIPYRQFTLVTRRQRRLPLFTAVNIDGRQPGHRHDRNAWVLRPRVPVDTWLRLEDYIVNHAITADQKISVISGPVLGDGEPGRREVVLPLQYWKLLAVVRTDGTLCTTGYLLRQKNLYAEYAAYQIPVRSIAEATGLDLSTYVAADPLERPGAAAQRRELLDVGDVRF
jgi:endonuclease G, mitochondrial